MQFVVILFLGNTPEKLKAAPSQAWSKETCYEPQQDVWLKENPAMGQCYVTALVLNDYLGGEILKAKSSNGVSHYWNSVDGEEIDFTRSQFPEDEVFTKPVMVLRENLEENERYRILKEKVESLL